MIGVRRRPKLHLTQVIGVNRNGYGADWIYMEVQALWGALKLAEWLAIEEIHTIGDSKSTID